MKNKKAVSAMVAYVLLIIIAITLSVFVYTWLKKQVPKESKECEADVSLIIESYNCDSAKNQFSLTAKNNGFFNVSGFYIRVSSDGTDVYSNISNTGTNLVYRGQAPIEKGLKPGEEYELKNINYPINSITNAPITQIMNIEIEPYLLKDNKVVLCGASVVKINTNQESGCLR